MSSITAGRDELVDLLTETVKRMTTPADKKYFTSLKNKVARERWDSLTARDVKMLRTVRALVSRHSRVYVTREAATPSITDILRGVQP